MTQVPYVPEYRVEAAGAGSKRWAWILMIQGIQAFVVVVGCMVVLTPFLGFLVGLSQVVVVSGIQWLLLMPIVEPQIGSAYRKPWRYWMSASMAGFLLGALICCAVGMLGDLLWVMEVLPSNGSGKQMTEESVGVIIGISLLALLVSWGLMIPLLVMFMKNRSPEKAVFQIASGIFLGTVVEALSSVGIVAMMNKKSDCVCATFSGITLVVTFAMGCVVFGPGIFLLVIWRRSRARYKGLCAACGADLSGAGYPAKCPVCGVGWKAAGAVAPPLLAVRNSV